MSNRSLTVGWSLIVGSAITTAAIYWSGLQGGFIYDDFSFIVGNAALEAAKHSPGDWLAAAMSFPSGSHQGRWLGMLSFALNHHISGLDPYWFKLTNLGIHLLNGLLLFLAMRALFDFYQACGDPENQGRSFNTDVAAATIASLWLVLPINLTCVLYVSQRLESLSTTFVFLGLWWYFRARFAHWDGRGASGMWLALVLCTGLGVLVKESAILLPLYAACAEFVLTGGRNRQGRWSGPTLSLYGGLLLLPLAFGLIWLVGWLDGTRTYGRAFDIPERLMTEGRILLDYIQWTLAPNLDVLTLYHDDIAISRSVLDPPSTLPSLLAIAGLLGVALWQRAKRPLLALGILWYFSGHLLTATIIPLMLAFEHRNYFPSVGLLLAGTSLLALDGLRPRIRIIAVLAICAFTFYAFTTALRAKEWSDPVRLTMSEASKRPLSPDAQFARARLMLTKLQRTDGTPAVDDAYVALERGRQLPGAGMLYEQLLITSHAYRKREIRKEWWDGAIAKLQARPANVSDARALASLNACFIEGSCGPDANPLSQAYAAALSHGEPMPALLSAHAEFAWYIQGDRLLAERNIREAVARAPNDLNARRNLAILLLANGEYQEVEAEIKRMQSRNWFGLFDNMISPIERALERKRKQASPQ